ncbi:MAG: MATE family efflux transporter [Micavibrio sp.]
MAHHRPGSRIDLKTGAVKTHLIRMTIPMIWGIAAMISMQLIDTYYISLLGTKELAAISFTFPVTMFIFYLIMGFGIAMSSVIARLIGEGREEDVRRITTHGIFLVTLTGLLLGFLGWIFHNPVFEAMGAGDLISPLIRSYMILWLAGVPFLAIAFAANASIRACGNASTPAYIMVGMAVLNALLTPVFMFGFFGLPRLEMTGAAIGTLLSQAVAAIACLWIIGHRQRMFVPLSRLQIRLFGNSCARILFIALPAGLTSAIIPFVNSIIVSLLAAYGSETVAAYGIASRVEAFGFIVLMALAVGMGPIIGQNLGALHFARVRETLRKAIGFSVLWSIATGALLMLLAVPIASLFSDDPIVVYYTKMAFLIIAPTYLFQALANGWSSAFNAMGKPQMAVAMTIVKMIVLTIPAVIFGAKAGGVMGIFMAIALVNVITGLAFHWWSLHALARLQARLAPQ